MWMTSNLAFSRFSIPEGWSGLVVVPGHSADSLSSCIRKLSSANRRHVELVFSDMSLMKIRNSSGPRTLTCGTPEVTGADVEYCWPSIRTCWLLLLGKLDIHCRTFPLMPLYCSLWASSLCETLSKCDRVGLRWKVVGDMTGWLGSSVVECSLQMAPNIKKNTVERPWVWARSSHNFSPVTEGLAEVQQNGVYLPRSSRLAFLEDWCNSRSKKTLVIWAIFLLGLHLTHQTLSQMHGFQWRTRCLDVKRRGGSVSRPDWCLWHTIDTFWGWCW